MTPSQIDEAQRLSRKFHANSEPAEAPDSSATEDAPVVATGSSFFITTDGWLVTNSHVVDKGETVRVVTNKGSMPAKVRHRDKANDLTLLKVEGNFEALPISPSRTVRLGQTVATIGFPNIGIQGFSPKLTKGEIGSLAGAQDDPQIGRAHV